MSRFGCLMAGLLTVWSLGSFGQAPVIPVWPGVPPGSEAWSQKEANATFYGQQVVRNVVQPTLMAFLPPPDKAVGSAVIVCPGGGFMFLSIDNEGTEVAKWLRDRGVAAFVLKYRLTDTGPRDDDYQARVMGLFAAATKRNTVASGGDAEALKFPEIQPLAVADAQEAIRVLRRRAGEWGLDPKRIGIIGFSAGAGVALGTATAGDALSRPDAVAAVYGMAPTGAALHADLPPLFALTAADDPIVPVGESLKLVQMWRRENRSVELHVYPKGGHGFGMRKSGAPTDGWVERYGGWLAGQGFLKPLNGYGALPLP